MSKYRVTVRAFEVLDDLPGSREFVVSYCSSRLPASKEGALRAAARQGKISRELLSVSLAGSWEWVFLS